MLKKLGVWVAMTVWVLGVVQPLQAQEPHIWNIQSIDTMKHSRDRARDKQILAAIPSLVTLVAGLGPTHISIGTPYDEEFIPVLGAWVREAHNQKLKVWFRGNFSGWEGWFDYPVLSSPDEHHKKLYEFIVNNSDLFENGDIFTPAPEPENGLIGDPRQSLETKDEFLKFLRESYQACKRAFWHIDKQVSCGYFSTNGDIAKDILDKVTVSEIGKTVTMDHYVQSPEVFGRDIDMVFDKYMVPVILGEMGAPIPDIHGELTEEKQADVVRKLFNELYRRKTKVGGVNYWVFSGGTTSLFNPDNSPRKVVEVVKDFYFPGVIEGTVRSSTGKRLSGIRVTLNSDLDHTVTDHKGSYSFTVPVGEYAIKIQDSNYQMVTHYQSVKRGAEVVQDIELYSVVTQTWWQQLWLDISEKIQMVQNFMNPFC